MSFLKRVVCGTKSATLVIFTLATWSESSEAQRAPDPLTEFVVSGAYAYGLLPPEFVSAGAVENFSFSDDGKYLALLTRPLAVSPTKILEAVKAERPLEHEDEELAVGIYSLKSSKLTIVARFKDSMVSVRKFAWLKGSSSLLLDVDESTPPYAATQRGRTSILLIHAPTTSVSLLAQEEWSSANKNVAGISAEASPHGAIGAFRRTKFVDGTPEDEEVRLFNARGWLGPPVPLPPGYAISTLWLQGRNPIVVVWRMESGQPKVRYFEVNTLTWTLVELPSAPDRETLERLEPPTPIYVEPRVIIREQRYRSRAVSAAFLTASDDDKESKALICGDVSRAILSPTLDATAYESSNALFVRKIIKLEKELFVRMRTKALQSDAMYRAARVWEALKLYADDHEGVLPSALGADIRTMLNAYATNYSVFEDFVYTYTGGNLGDILDPANTQIGYIENAGGRAVLFANGFVRWLANK